MTRLSVVIVALCAALATGCQPSGEPGSSWENHFIAVSMFAEEVNGQIVNPVIARGIGLQANMLQGLDGSSGNEVFNSRYTNSQGRLTFSGARLPAIWRITWTTGLPPPDGCWGKKTDLRIETKTPQDDTVWAILCSFERVAVDGKGTDTQGNLSWTGNNDKLLPDERLYPDQSRRSADGRFNLVYQSDGNLVLYSPWGPLWASDTFGQPGFTIMQLDGNLVIYDAGGTPVWHSGTVGNNDALLVVQSDGDVTIRRQDATVIWWTGTCCYW